jgi:hypothetical protein
MIQRISSQRWLTFLFALVVLFASSFLVVARFSPNASATAVTPAPPCPLDWTCTPMPCPTEGQCGVIQVGPTSHLGNDQWIYIRAYGLIPQNDNYNSLGVYYCQGAETTLSPAPNCALSGNPLLSNPSTETTPLANGTTAFSFHVPVVDPASGNPLVGGIPPDGSGQGTNHSFYCTQDERCSVVVVYKDLNTVTHDFNPTPIDAVRIPLTFQDSSNGCPDGKVIGTESEFGIERLLPRVSPYLCTGAVSAVPFNTAINGLGAVTALAEGSIEVAFSDDPNAPDQQAQLKKIDSIAIPIVTSANVVAFRGQMTDYNHVYPKSSLSLTANAVGGILTGLYTSPAGIDVAPCNGQCPQYPDGPCPFPTGYCSFFDRLNFSYGFLDAIFYGAFLRSDNAGVTDQLFQWLCAMPEASADFNGASKEIKTASQIVQDGLTQALGTPITACPNTDQFTPLPISGSAWAAVNSPSQQMNKLNAYVQPQDSSPGLGIAPMNWAEANYYGLASASIQNAAGAFVAPSPESINAALNDSTKNPNGTITPSYTNNQSSGAYAMPTVIYAIVNQSPSVPKEDQEAIRSILTQLLNVTSGADTPSTGTSQSVSSSQSTIPTMTDGFVPLNADLAVLARDEVAHAIGNPSYKINWSLGDTPSSSNANSSTFSSTGFQSSSSTTASSATSSSSGSTKPFIMPSSSPLYAPFLMSALNTKLGVMNVLGLGILAAALGASLMLYRIIRRRIALGKLTPSEEIIDE